jgi:hypothetical protein
LAWPPLVPAACLLGRSTPFADLFGGTIRSSPENPLGKASLRARLSVRREHTSV